MTNYESIKALDFNQFITLINNYNCCKCNFCIHYHQKGTAIPCQDAYKDCERGITEWLNAEIELLPCPFCGGVAILHKLDNKDYKVWVCCDNCGNGTAIKQNAAEAIRLWNERSEK